jgi:hypothetical protein
LSADITNRPGTVERAFELAKSGTCANVNDVRARLSQEGHEAVQQHLSGPSLRRDLARLCKAASD